MNSGSQKDRDNLSEYLIRIADDLLILGHRISEWCGHGPILEEDIALANIALDCIGQANNFLTLAAELKGKGLTADKLAFFREPTEFKNYQLVEQPNGDFAVTIVRQVLFDAYAVPFFESLAKSSHVQVAGLAARALKEVTYHLRHCKNWLLRLGLGTEESKIRAQNALNDLWDYTFELAQADELDQELMNQKIAPDLKSVRQKWEDSISNLIKEAGLSRPSDECYKSSGSKHGVHSEHLGYILAEMQVLPRAHPNAEW